MTEKLNYTEVREYMKQCGLKLYRVDLGADEVACYVVEYPNARTYRRPRRYATVRNALVFNAPGGTEADTLERFAKWRLERWQRQVAA